MKAQTTLFPESWLFPREGNGNLHRRLRECSTPSRQGAETPGTSNALTAWRLDAFALRTLQKRFRAFSLNLPESNARNHWQ